MKLVWCAHVEKDLNTWSEVLHEYVHITQGRLGSTVPDAALLKPCCMVIQAKWAEENCHHARNTALAFASSAVRVVLCVAQLKR